MSWKIRILQFLEQFSPISKNRVGSCVNCGRCCQLGSKCFFYRDNKCKIYVIRPLQCRKSPRTSKYLKKGCKGYDFL